MDIAQFPDEILLELTTHIPTLSLLRFLSLSKRLWNLRYRIPSKTEPFLTVIQKYRDCVYLYKKNWTAALEISITQRCRECTDHFLEVGGTTINFNHCMGVAAEYGDMDLIEIFISKGATDFNLGMINAASRGHKKIVDFFLSKGANRFNDAMAKAAQGGHKDLVDKFIALGANDWNLGLIIAAAGGQEDLVKFFVSKGADSWSDGLNSATVCGNINLMTYFVEKGAALDGALKRATNRETAKFLVEHGAKDLESALFLAAASLRVDVVKYLFEAKPNMNVARINPCMTTAANLGNMELVTFLVSKGANDFNGALKSAVVCRKDNKAIVDYLIELGANDWNGAMCEAIHYPHHRYLIDFFIQKGANDFKKALATASSVNIDALPEDKIQHYSDLKNLFSYLLDKQQ